MTTTHYRHFDKFNFVESLIASINDPIEKEKKKKEAVIIAQAITDSHHDFFDNLATKRDVSLVKQDVLSLRQDIALVRKDMELLGYHLVIKLTVIMTTLLTLLPLVTDFLKNIF